MRLTGLDRRARGLAILALAVIALACVVIVLLGAGWPLPGGTVAIPGTMLAERAPVEIAVLAPVLACTGLAVAAALLVDAGLRARPRLGQLALLGVGLAGAALSAMALQGVGQYDVFAHMSGAPDVAYTLLPRAAGVAALACSVLLILLPASLARSRPVPVLALASAPFVLPLVPLIINVTRSLPVSAVAQALNPEFPASISSVAWVAGPVQAFTTVIGFSLIPLALWQAVTWARASARQLGGHIGAAAERWPTLVIGLAAAKLGWALLGWAGALPLAFGGGSETWAGLREDGPAAWLYGVALIALGIALLRYLRRRPISDRRATSTAAWTVALFWSLFAGAAVLVLVLPLAFLLALDDAAVGAAASFVLGLLLERAAFVGGLVVLGALVVGLAWLISRRRTSAAVFLVVLGAWTLPRAVGVLAETAPPELAFLRGLPAIDAPGLPLMDLLLSGAVLLVGAAGTLGRLRGISWGLLAIALVVSTLLAHGGALTPSGAGVLFFALALVFPVAYELLLDSERLNLPGRDRQARLLRGLGLRAAVLALIAVAASVNLTALFGSPSDNFAKLLFALPLSVIIVISAGRPAAQPAVLPEPAAGPAGDGLPRRALIALAAGLLVVAVPAIGLRPLDAQLAALYPTPADYFAEFEAERQRVVTGLEIALGDDASEIGGSLLEHSASASAWLRSHRPVDCLGSAWRAHGDFVEELRRWSLVVDAAERVGAGLEPASEEERAEIGRRLESGLGDVQRTASLADETAASAATACEGRRSVR